MIPVLGAIPDTVDLIYTLAELPSGHSSGSDAALAALGVAATFAPGAGDGAAAAAKIANRALDAGEVIAKNAGDIKVIGRLDDTAVAKDWAGHDVLNIPDWTPKKNAQWVDDGIMNKQNFYTASPETGNMIQTSGPYKGQPTIYNMEIQQLNDAGYAKVGDYYVHPDNVANFTP